MLLGKGPGNLCVTKYVHRGRVDERGRAERGLENCVDPWSTRGGLRANHQEGTAYPSTPAESPPKPLECAESQKAVMGDR